MSDHNLKPVIYVYTPLKDALPGKTYNVYGVVKYLTTPVKSRGTDYFMQVSITDPSFELDKLVCMLFFKSLGQQPRCDVGDIIRFHRLKVGEHNSKPQGSSAPGFSWAVFDSNESGDVIKPKAHSGATYTLQPIDSAKVRELRAWCADIGPLSQMEQELRYTAVPHEQEMKYVTFSSVACGEIVTIIAQVVRRSIVDFNLVILRIWDGTKVNFPVKRHDITLNPENISSDQLLEDVSKGYQYDIQCFDSYSVMTKHLKAGDFIKIVGLQAVTCSNETGLGLPTIDFRLQGKSRPGVTKSVDIASLDFQPTLTLKRRLNDIITATELLSEASQVFNSTFTASDCRALEVAGESAPTSPDRGHRVIHQPGNIAFQHGSESPSRNSLVESPNLLVNSISASVCMKRNASYLLDHHSIPLSTIRDVRTCNTPHIFHVRVQVQDFYPPPTDLKSFIHVYCSTCNYLEQLGTTNAEKQDILSQVDIDHLTCPECTRRHGQQLRIGRPRLEYIFAVRFILFDQTGWLDANLWRDEANQFFNTTAEELLRYPERFQPIKEKLTTLPASVYDEAEWLECCLKSYNTAEFGQCYKIFDTQLAMLDKSSV